MSSPEAAETGSDVPTNGTFSDITEAYSELDMPASRYLLVAVVPSILFFFVTVVAMVTVSLPMLISVPTMLLSVLALFSAVFYPRILVAQRRTQLENHLHLAVTHMTVLSTTNINRMNVFRKVSNEDEYEAFAEEMRRIVQLVDTWNQSLDDACRRRSREIPSEELSDFLDRMSYSLSAGQELNDFLKSEHEAIVSSYETIYEGSLENLDVMKDLYLSMILSMTFGLVFATVLPLLTGNNPTLIIAAVIVLFVVVQSGFFLMIRAITPTDPVWYHPSEVDISVDAERRALASLVGGFVAMLVVGAVVVVDMFGLGPRLLTAVYPGGEVPIVIYASATITPLAIPGLVMRRAERKVKSRDQEFPSFIRALGATESAKQSTTSAVLSDLRTKDFGALSENVDDLYKRLNMRIEPHEAWEYFAAETQSYLIQKFGGMYLVGREMGGDPKELGELISENMNVVMQLRERRRQATITLVGLLYGITAAASFAFYIGLEIVRVLSNLSLDLAETNRFVGTELINTGVYDIPTVEFLLLNIILFNALLSSLMIRTVDSGHKVNSYLHFVAMTWLGSLVSVLTGVAVSGLLNV
jgi:flagellar protein FlaJ